MVSAEGKTFADMLRNLKACVNPKQLGVNRREVKSNNKV